MSFHLPCFGVLPVCEVMLADSKFVLNHYISSIYGKTETIASSSFINIESKVFDIIGTCLDFFQKFLRPLYKIKIATLRRSLAHTNLITGNCVHVSSVESSKLSSCSDTFDSKKMCKLVIFTILRVSNVIPCSPSHLFIYLKR